jgi:drug/metabolite transporter (DMT)-like permease
MSRRAWLAFAAMSVLWGCSYLLIRIAVRGGMPAADVAWTRVFIAAVLLLALSWRAGLLRSVRGRWRWLAAYAVVEISIPFPLIAAGEVHVASSLLGAGAILIAAVGYAIGPMVVKHRLDGLDPRAMMGASLALATVILAPFAALDEPSRAPTAGAWASVVGLGVFCTALAFVVFAVLIREAGTSRATVITYVNPLVAVVLGVTLEGERPGAGAIAGLLLILAGSWLSTGGRLPPTRRSPCPDPAGSDPSLTRA